MVGAFIEIYMINQHKVNRKLENYYLTGKKDIDIQ